MISVKNYFFQINRLSCYMRLRAQGLLICKNITRLKKLMSPSFFTYRAWWVLPQTASERKHAAEQHRLRKNYRNATVFEGINNKTVYAQYSNPASSEYKGRNGLV